ncbi:MAG: aminopeptidase P N-terminal domain-containing protein, partial [Myxococcota bacterium]
MFNERRERVCEAMGPDAVAVFVGAKRVTRSADTEYRFRQ